jgi:hypothetical protein
MHRSLLPVHLVYILSPPQLYELDAEYTRALQWTLANDITDIIYETFTVTQDVFGETREVPLVKGGQDIEVTESNKKEYVEALLAWRTGGSVQAQLDAMVKGFRELVPPDAVRIFSPMQLQLLLNGNKTIKLDELRASTILSGYGEGGAGEGGEDVFGQSEMHRAAEEGWRGGLQGQPARTGNMAMAGNGASGATSTVATGEGEAQESTAVVWFWEVMAELNDRQQAKVLHFITGSDKVPMDGFEPRLQLSKMGIDLPPVDAADGATEAWESSLPLPTAHTCFNQLVLPEYPSRGVLKRKLVFAVQESEGFQLV